MIEHSPAADYLGDGVYADVSEYGELLLTTEDGVHVSNRIVLEVPVVRALLRYIERNDCAQENGRDPRMAKTLCQVFSGELVKFQTEHWKNVDGKMVKLEGEEAKAAEASAVDRFFGTKPSEGP